MALANKTFQRILRQTNKDISEMATARHIQQIRQADSTLFAMHMQGADQTAPNQQGGKRRSIAAGGRPRRSRPQKRVREQAEAMKRAVSSSSESDDEEDKSAVRKQPLRPIDVALNSGGKNKAARLKTPKLECDDVIILSPPRETPAPIVEIADVAPSAPEIAPNPPLLLPQPPQPQPPLPQPQPPLLLPLLPPPLSPPTQPASLPLVYREQPTAVNAQQRQSEPSSRIIDVMAQNRATNVSACQPTVSSADSSSSGEQLRESRQIERSRFCSCSRKEAATRKRDANYKLQRQRHTRRKWAAATATARSECTRRPHKLAENVGKHAFEANK